MATLDDELITALERTLHSLLPLTSTNSRKCALLGVHAQNIHFVDVPLIAGVTCVAKFASVNDLDVFLWLPKLGASGSSFVDLTADRYTYAHKQWELNVITTTYYTFIYYNQEVHNNLQKNELIASIIGVAYPWMGNMLIVKSEGNLLQNMNMDDYEVISNILRRILTDGTLA